MALISDETLVRLSVHILSTKYLEDKTLCLTKILKHNNVHFNYKVVEIEDSKKDGKEMHTNLEIEASK